MIKNINKTNSLKTTVRIFPAQMIIIQSKNDNNNKNTLLPQVAYIRKPKVKSFTVANFREYNAIYRRVLKDTGVVFWDSTLPLSRAYNQECLRNPRHLEDTLLWMCKDVVHVGYILWNQYADMVLNAACGQRMSNCV